jgi:hypothetical protein
MMKHNGRQAYLILFVLIGPEESEAVQHVLDSRWSKTRSATQEFERGFAAVAVNSRTAAPGSRCRWKLAKGIYLQGGWSTAASSCALGMCGSLIFCGQAEAPRTR